MGRGRGRVVAAFCGLGVLALLAGGCGAEEHANEPRAQPPTRVAATITEDTITLQPSRIAVGPEPTQQIPQNQNVEQPPIRSNAPLDVVIVAANLTDTDSKLRIRGPKDVVTGPLVANGNGSLLTSLPTGVYTVSAAGMPNAKPARLSVGPVRTSSQNDLLLP